MSCACCQASKLAAVMWWQWQCCPCCSSSAAHGIKFTHTSLQGQAHRMQRSLRKGLVFISSYSAFFFFFFPLAFAKAEPLHISSLMKETQNLANAGHEYT